MVHGPVSTQRVAHLNVNAVQQIQSFFVGTLPRELDRRAVAKATETQVLVRLKEAVGNFQVGFFKLLFTLNIDAICLAVYSFPTIVQIRVYRVVPRFLGCKLSAVAGFLSNGKILYLCCGLLIALS